MRRLSALLAVAISATLSARPAPADLIVYGTHTDHALSPGARLDEVRLSVQLVVTDGLATMSFTNVSLRPAVLKEIVVDTYDDDAGAAILWDAAVLTDTADVAYSLRPSNGLPGYRHVRADSFPLLELQAQAPPVRKGLGVGETLLVQFATWLPDGTRMEDYPALFGGGPDTGAHCIGFHAISADVVNGESLSGTYLPEPFALALIILGALPVLKRWLTATHEGH